MDPDNLPDRKRVDVAEEFDQAGMKREYLDAAAAPGPS